jgi:hypothetical protein
VHEFLLFIQQKKENLLLAHNSRGTCASYQSISAPYPPHSAYESIDLNTPHCYLCDIYRISAAAAPAVEKCFPVLTYIRSSFHPAMTLTIS